MEKAFSYMAVDVKAAQAEHETRILEKLSSLETVRAGARAAGLVSYMSFCWLF